MMAIFVFNIFFSFISFIIVSASLVDMVEDQYTPEGRNVWRTHYNGFYGDDKYHDTEKYVKHLKPSVYNKRKKVLTISAAFIGISCFLSTLFLVLNLVNFITIIITVFLTFIGFSITAILNY